MTLLTYNSNGDDDDQKQVRYCTAGGIPIVKCRTLPPDCGMDAGTVPSIHMLRWAYNKNGYLTSWRKPRHGQSNDMAISSHNASQANSTQWKGCNPSNSHTLVAALAQTQ